ncbi:ABC transporter ATP-binding protein [Leptospira idonii]|uniref:ABC transporter ATP-binding protein n=1 Tax=Leptospira idonii TaxID=1193500 RepID=A0A4R9LYR3_9LEPT|nr:ABC transporter ATP-binding protein [Leptospira idonii]TGN17874.1 ABC transporter ATP-binding protein [Leptospira idonii]
MNSFIEIRNLNKTYRLDEVNFPVLKNLNLTLPQKKLITLMGPSGSGKSTLLNILSAIETSDSGEVYVDGDNLTGKTEKQLTLYRREKIGIVFQFFHLLSYLSALENTALPLYLNGHSKKEALHKAEEALKTVGLEHRMKFTPKELSGGEKQRVAVARAIVHKPKLILADEPTGNLDSTASDQIIKLFRNCVNDLGITVFMVTHNPEIGTIGDINLHILDGQIRNK